MIKKFFPLMQIIFLLAGVACWQMVFPFKEEADTHFAMNLGRYILEHGFPHVDPFTVHENLQLVAQQWLSGIFFWEAYKNFGVNGLLIVDFIFGAMMILIYWRACLFFSDGNKILAFVMTFVVGIFIATSIVPRPQIFSTPLLIAEVFFLEKFTRTGDAKFLLPLMPLSTLIINFHAAVWLMTLVLCLPFMFVKNFRHVKFLSAAMIGIFLCGLINPYGFDAMTYVLRSYGIEIINEHIPEMFSPTAHDLTGKIFFLTETLMIFTLAKFKLPWRYIFLSGGIIFMAVMHLRNGLLFYLIATLPAAYAWKNFAPEKFFKGRILPTTLLLFLLAVNVIIIVQILNDGFDKISLPLKIFFAATSAVIFHTLLIVKAEGRILHPNILPRKILLLFVTAIIVCGIYFLAIGAGKKNPPHPYTQAIEFLLRSERPENISLYVNQGIGGLAGSYGIRYYIDSRSEVFIAANNGRKNIFAEYLDFRTGKISYKDFFSRYNFTHIITTTDEPFLFDELSHDKNFRVIYESEHVDGSNVTRCKIFVPRK